MGYGADQGCDVHGAEASDPRRHNACADALARLPPTPAGWCGNQPDGLPATPARRGEPRSCRRGAHRAQHRRQQRAVRARGHPHHRPGKRNFNGGRSGRHGRHVHRRRRRLVSVTNGREASATIGTNAGPAGFVGSARSPVRAARRQPKTRCGQTCQRRAIALTTAPGTKASATIRAFCASDQRRRRAGTGSSSIRRNSLFASSLTSSITIARTPQTQDVQAHPSVPAEEGPWSCAYRQSARRACARRRPDPCGARPPRPRPRLAAVRKSRGRSRALPR